jgi:MFS superfamily sulfate permease-like transporter
MALTSCFNRNFFKADLRASFVVFLIALPLGMGIAIASGYPPVAGIITGIVGGILVGAISGAPLQVSGAAAGLTVIVFTGVQQLGMKQMAVAILLAGAMQLIGGAARLGRWFQAASPTVLHGMLAGIGLLILAGQFHVMLDLAPAGSGLQNLKAIPASMAKALAPGNLPAFYALCLGAATIFILVLWPKLEWRFAKASPAPLMAVGIATILAAVVALPVNYVSIPENVFASWNTLDLEALSSVLNPDVLAFALQLALIASAESLLCAAATDQLHEGDRAKLDRELFSQGIGNLVCGLLGALPMTGVIVRSSANINAGAKTRASAILHGVWLLIFVCLLPQLLAYIPISALAGLLVFTGAKLLNVKVIRTLYLRSKGELVIFCATAVTVVTVDLLFGVILGLALSGIKLLYTLSNLHIDLEHRPDEDRLIIELRGAATFVRLPKLVDALEKMPKGSIITVRSHKLHLIDHACVDHLAAWRRRHENQGGKIHEEGEAIFA